jgi:acetolactate synthase-1/2/3 large subunit
MQAHALDELELALSTAKEASGPFLVDCHIQMDELVLPMLAPAGSLDDIIVEAGK